MARHHRLVAASFAVTLIAPTAVESTAAVYRCEDDGQTLFSQFPCRGQAEPHRMAPLPVIRTAPITDAERRHLDALSRELDRQRDAARRSRSRAAAAQQRLERDRARRCEQARRALEQLARVRRGGYSLKEAARLNAREADLDDEVRTHC